MNKRFIYGSLAAVTGIVSIVSYTPLTAFASTTLTQRKNALISAKIIENFDVTLNEQPVSRAQFAKMLVMASTYHTMVAAESNVSVFSDVLSTSEYASYIRIAAEQGWLSAYLGGLFKPDQGIKMAEAEKACLTLLGYSNSDFSGNLVSNRNAKSTAIGLVENISKGVNEFLTYEDCVNLFYNLMKTNTYANESSTKSDNTIYGKIFGFNLSDNDELNLLSTLESNLKGPYLLKVDKSLSSIIPFSESSASCTLNGETSSVDEIEDAASSGDPVVVYYNSSTKSVYAYSSSGSDMGTTTGTIDSIYYSSTNLMTPTSVVIGGEEFDIGNDDVAYAFSVYGSKEVDDTVTVVWSLSSDGTKEITAVAK
ncbi:S-layer homology domain-containing protein [Oribacterium sp. WCC10]|uniref:S-layer homology domain-containing protein n=1 Tax=Oribacterium sp. WCC10 TaxID=1855343 RepID=UPI0008E0FB54|nr:S-layer homology domain-containing protein [Oribacterium sp. WCC10]SFG61815.1 S-layer homology domain-containing protein [Oribacterium sp. WCC10]